MAQPSALTMGMVPPSAMIRSAPALFAAKPRAKAQERSPSMPKALSPSRVDALYLMLENDGETPMAMTMNGQVQLPASREVVWAKLNDPEVLKSCIPGSEQFDKISESEFQAVATVKVGPVKARWKGKVRLSDLDPQNGYRISGEGEGGAA